MFLILHRNCLVAEQVIERIDCAAEVALPTSLLCAFRLGGMVAHRLETDTTGADETIEDEGRAGNHAADSPENAAAALGCGNRCHLHLHRGVFPEPRARLYIQRLAGGQRLLKDVAVAVQQHHAFAVDGAELVDEQAGATEENVSRALHEGEAVVHVAGCDQELVFAHLDHLVVLQAEGHDLSYGVTGEGNIAGAGGLGDEDGQTGEHMSGGSLERLEADLHTWVLPEQDMMLEIDGHLIAEHDIDNGYQFTINGNRQVADM